MLPYQQLSDSDLLKLLKSDDQKAFTELYERYHSLLYIYANKKLEANSQSLDIVQDILLSIWNKRSTLHITVTLRSYLFTAIRNRILDVFTHQKVETKYLDSLKHIMETYSPSDHLIREKELKTLIDQEIKAMPPRMREIFILSRKEWLSNHEIANRLSISQSTVETQMKRALRHLRLKLSHFANLLLELLAFYLIFF
ncbi:RNA polymerase sigma-70 factor [Sphingobacterium faecale]|uniref:RNA polymerase sigma-70 factor n=1 Tax=Sphingobacterium faecale TaxID=2803775 RepID=A0ABS1R3Y3_9SPHI|nr:RNA polymerase sigma-70 factor [Sphingobacterium faecale]MBL1409426.1 RNA polymerase sigma-70 factor [Sphingobacterium faecale]